MSESRFSVPRCLPNTKWDTERSLRGAALNYFSIQVSVSRHLIHQYVNEWTVQIEDLSGLVTRMRDLLRDGKVDNAKRLLPNERIYPVDPFVEKQIGQR
jgi:hypothetical protein